MARDRALLGQLRGQVNSSSSAIEREKLTEEMETLEKRLENHLQALQRVETGRTLTAW